MGRTPTYCDTSKTSTGQSTPLASAFMVNCHLYLKGLPSVAYNSSVTASVQRARLSRPSFCPFLNPTVQSTLGNSPSQIPSRGTQGSRGRTSQTPWQTDGSGVISFLAPRPEGSNDDDDEIRLIDSNVTPVILRQ